MGHLHKIRREIKKNPSAWLNKGATYYGTYKQRKGRTRWSPTYMYKTNKPYGKFVHSVLKELGFIKPAEVKPATQTQLEIFGRIYNIPPQATSVEEFDKMYERFLVKNESEQLPK